MRDGSGRASLCHLLTKLIADRYFSLFVPIEEHDHNFPSCSELPAAEADFVDRVEGGGAHRGDADANVDRFHADLSNEVDLGPRADEPDVRRRAFDSQQV